MPPVEVIEWCTAAAGGTGGGVVVEAVAVVVVVVAVVVVVVVIVVEAVAEERLSLPTVAEQNQKLLVVLVRTGVTAEESAARAEQELGKAQREDLGGGFADAYWSFVGGTPLGC